MTMTDAGTVRIMDGGLKAPVDIPGTRIGFGTSQRPDSIAWAEIEIYELHDGGYMAHRAGYSLVYHRADTSCMTRDRRQKGDPAGVDDLPDDAVPCERCRPEDPEYLPDGPGTVRFEFPRHTFDSCATPEQVVERLTVIRHRSRTRSVHYSQPVKDALAQAVQNSPRFRAGTGDGVLVE